MLEDRSYMRSPSYGASRSAAVILIIVNVVCYFLQLLLGRIGSLDFYHYLALSKAGALHGYLWQFITFQFLHSPDNILHIVFNCLGLYMFGRPVEETLGKSRFLTLYFATGILGGLTHILCEIAFPKMFFGYVIGASAGLYGLIAAYARLFPEGQITFLVFWVLPVTITARLLLILSIVLAVFGMLGRSGVAHDAHLGGLLAGLAYMQWFAHSNWQFPKLGLPKFPRKTGEAKVPAPTVQWGKPKKEATVREEFTPDFISKEVDPILDKISAQGIQSLTERERKILEAARAKMAKR